MSYAVHEPIGRTIQLAAPMRVEDVLLRQNEAYPDLPPSFHCRPLLADITAATCKTNFLAHKGVSCRGCIVGMMHAAVTSRTAIDVLNDESLNRHERAMAKNSLACVRCMKDSSSNKRLQMGMRLVRAGTICVSCWNRESECKRGLNSKNGQPRKWASCLRPTSVVIRKDGKLKTVDIGMTTGPSEAMRHAERRNFDLVEIWIDGERGEAMPDVAPLSVSTIVASKASKPRKQRTTHLRVETGRDFELDDDEAAEPSAPVADTVAPIDATESVSEPAGSVAAALTNHETAKSEWAGCYVTDTDGTTTYVCDYARQHSLTDWQAAVALGACDADYEDGEAEVTTAPAPEPEPVKREPASRRLTGKQQRKAQKAARRAERARNQAASAHQVPTIKQTAAAYMAVLFAGA
ncbi:hypothetical protein [Paraburkholderia aromaticivorans]|uniref:hypothetical protein n=1 Tax=Paraburkholderia aromaticivorans TaxID=2026199 RepID=UPI0014562149|nr:hypothetical protein [Paraburkholderia aromaticivorans]